MDDDIETIKAYCLAILNKVDEHTIALDDVFDTLDSLLAELEGREVDGEED